MATEPIAPIGGPFAEWRWHVDGVERRSEYWNHAVVNERHEARDTERFVVWVSESGYGGRQYTAGGDSLADACESLADHICAIRDKQRDTPDPPNVFRSKKYEVRIGEFVKPDDLWPAILAAAKVTLDRTTDESGEA